MVFCISQSVKERFDELRKHHAYDIDLIISNRTADSEPIDMSKIPKNSISVETPARILEKDLFLAQCIANIDRFGHPNPNNPAESD
jgi:hypothetical protein